MFGKIGRLIIIVAVTSGAPGCQESQAGIAYSKRSDCLRNNKSPNKKTYETQKGTTLEGLGRCQVSASQSN